MRGLWRLKLLQERWKSVLRLRAAERAVANFPRTSAKQKHDMAFPVIVSLTSYPPRFQTLAATLKSLIDQDVQPDLVVLWVTADDFLLLPKDVVELKEFGLDIRICEEYLSYKKLIPSLECFPEAAIVTADDDLYFPPNWLSSLLASYDHHHPAIVCARAHLAKVGADGRLLPYASWVLDTLDTRDVSEFELLFPTGGAGALYPPHVFPAEICDPSGFLRLCPRGDDLWFFWLAEQSGVPHVRVPEHFPLVCWRGSQDAGLFHDNVVGGGNDQQIANLQDALGLLRDTVPRWRVDRSP